jgi:ketosteroid isomerase-like protein
MPAPSTPEGQLAWLVDRAQISDVLIRYARCADLADWPGIAALFTEDGLVTAPFGGSYRGRDFGERAGPFMARFAATHHMSTNHAIEIDGDRATAHSYLQAVHVTAPDERSRHADIGGWYDHTFVREDGVWRIASMTLTFVWTAGEPFGRP